MYVCVSVLYSSQGGVSIERSALHESELLDKSEDSPLMRDDDGDSSSRESEPSPRPKKVNCLPQSLY